MVSLTLSHVPFDMLTYSSCVLVLPKHKVIYIKDEIAQDWAQPQR